MSLRLRLPSLPFCEFVRHTSALSSVKKGRKHLSMVTQRQTHADWHSRAEIKFQRGTVCNCAFVQSKANAPEPTQFRRLPSGPTTRAVLPCPAPSRVALVRINRVMANGATGRQNSSERMASCFRPHRPVPSAVSPMPPLFPGADTAVTRPAANWFYPASTADPHL